MTTPATTPADGELLPCPWCGAGTTEFQNNGAVWLGMKGYSEPTSVSIRHWCPAVQGQPARMIERVGRDRESAIVAWNRRAPSSRSSTMTDRELLELAAKAAGMDILWSDDPDRWPMDASNQYRIWNPLADDGDALRLAVKLRIYVATGNFSVHTCADDRQAYEEIIVGQDPYAATRRAIVRAAAEIGTQEQDK